MVRVRPWAPNSVAPFPFILCASCSRSRCRKEMLWRRGSVSQRGVAGHSGWAPRSSEWGRQLAAISREVAP